MNFRKISTLASFAVLTTGIVASVKPVQALTLNAGSTINIAGDVTLTGLTASEGGPLLAPNGEPLSSLDFLNFDGTNGASSGEFVITSGTDSFSSFGPVGTDFLVGTVLDLPTTPGNPFTFVPTDDFLTFTDRDGTVVDFDLEDLGDPVYTQSGNSTSITLGAVGNFDTDMQTNVPGQFVFAAEFVGRGVEEVRGILEGGGVLDGESNSGNGIVEEPPTTPEPSSIISLVALGLASAGFLAGKGKQKQISS